MALSRMNNSVGPKVGAIASASFGRAASGMRSPANAHVKL